MKMMTQEDMDRWKKTRVIGKRRYVIRETLVYASIPLASAFLWRSLRFLWTGNLTFNSIDYGQSLFLSGLFVAWGYAQSSFRWQSQEARYKASIEPGEIA
jgi:hypothetical protein